MGEKKRDYDGGVEDGLFLAPIEIPAPSNVPTKERPVMRAHEKKACTSVLKWFSDIPRTLSTKVKPVRLTIKEADWTRLRASLLQEDDLERQAFLELGMVEDDERFDLFLYRFLPLEDQDYVFQGPYHVQPNGSVVVNAYNSFQNAGVPVHGHIHSHPFSHYGDFSSVDRKTLRDMARGLSGLVEATRMEEPAFCFQMVTGTNPSGFQGFLTDLKGRIVGKLKSVRVVGRGGTAFYSRGPADVSRPGLLQDERLNRNIRWLGEEGQALLARAHVAVCGVGGAGAMLVANLRGLGFGEITLVDPDRVEASNLNRLTGAGRRDVGQYKVHVLKREILKVMRETRINALPVGVEAPEAREHIRRTDVVLAALDGMGPRAELQILCARLLKPFFDIGSGILLDKERNVKRMGSQIIVYVPEGPCLACQGMDLFRPDSGIAGELRRRTGYVVGTDFTPTSVATINSVVAGWAVDLLIRYLTGMGPIPLYTEIDQWSGAVRQIPFVKRSSCAICGENGVEGKGEDTARPLTPPEEGLTFNILDVSKEAVN